MNVPAVASRTVQSKPSGETQVRSSVPGGARPAKQALTPERKSAAVEPVAAASVVARRYRFVGDGGPIGDLLRSSDR
jgi:hypothetical protein